MGRSSRRHEAANDLRTVCDSQYAHYRPRGASHLFCGALRMSACMYDGLNSSRLLPTPKAAHGGVPLCPKTASKGLARWALQHGYFNAGIPTYIESQTRSGASRIRGKRDGERWTFQTEIAFQRETTVQGAGCVLLLNDSSCASCTGVISLARFGRAPDLSASA